MTRRDTREAHDGAARRRTPRTFLEEVRELQDRNVEFVLGTIDGSAEIVKLQADLGARMAKTFVRQTAEQQRTFNVLAGMPAGICAELLRAPAPVGVAGRRSSAGNGAGDASDLPIEDYDRLSVEEVGQRLAELDASELEDLMDYERRHKNRTSMLERFERALD